MRQASRAGASIAGVLFAAILAPASLGAHAGDGGSAPAAAQGSAFLGYRVGEERRYVLGPPEALSPGEDGRWSIHLRELLGEPADGIFVLAHQWHRADTGMELPIGTITSIESEGELRVNGHGFPLEVSLRTKRHLAGMGDEVYSIDYRYEDGRYRKQVSADGQMLAYTVSIRGHEHLDRSLPAGMYAFEPTAADCSVPGPIDIRRAAPVRGPRRTAGSPAGPAPPTTPTRFADNRWCRESLFANPGLVTLMMPALREEATGERSFLLLTPTGATGIGGFTIAGPVAPRGSDFSAAPRPENNWRVERLRYLERGRVEVGSRARDAWIFDRMGEFEAIYVDDDDVVVRVDIADGWARRLSAGGEDSIRPTTLDFDPTAPGSPRSRHLHVRLLFPSEY